MQNKYLVAVPVFNELESVGRVLPQVCAYGLDLLVVDDGSDDGTAQELDRVQPTHVINHAGNLGYGRSLSDVFAFAVERGYDWLITMDCDEQHDPAAIPCFISAAEQGHAEIISGSRYLRSFADDGTAPADRRAINRTMTDLLNRDLGLGLTDAFCGYKAYRVSVLGGFEITESGYAMPLQLWVQAARRGLRVVELPVRRIYKDLDRRFGGALDDPHSRQRYYLEVLERELARGGSAMTSDALPRVTAQ
ncbi:MAG: glycosyltransferase family 2 protein [bacterium]|nr:glycosyltransferase family 2 protein [bacterium]